MRLHQQQGRRSIGAANKQWRMLCQPPISTKKRPGCSRTKAVGYSKANSKPNVIPLARTAQQDLRALRARLLRGYAAGRLGAGFVQQCLRNFPELVGP